MDAYRAAIIRWHQQGQSFSFIEDAINSMEELDDETRSALWLYAWSLRSRGAQISEATQLLAHSFAD